MMTRLHTLRSAVWGACLCMAALLLPASSFAQTSTPEWATPGIVADSDAAAFGKQSCVEQGGTWDGDSDTCNYGAKDPATGAWKCIDGAKWDESQNRCVPTGGWDPEQEKPMCIMSGHTWDPSRPAGEQCVDSNGTTVDVYCEETVKEAIEGAMRTHMEFGALQPHIEEIFKRSADCFKGATTIWDLSPSIPTIWDFISSIITALKNYIVQEVCNIAYKISDKMRGAISEVISTIQGLSSVGDISIANLSSTLFAGSNGSNLLNKITFAGSAPDRSGETNIIDPNGLNLQQRVFNPAKCDANTILARASSANGKLTSAQEELDTLRQEALRAAEDLKKCNEAYQTYLLNQLPGNQSYQRHEEYCKTQIAEDQRLSAAAAAAAQEITEAEEDISGDTCEPGSTWRTGNLDYGLGKHCNGTLCTQKEIQDGTCPCPRRDIGYCQCSTCPSNIDAVLTSGVQCIANNSANFIVDPSAGIGGTTGYTLPGNSSGIITILPAGSSNGSTNSSGIITIRPAGNTDGGTNSVGEPCTPLDRIQGRCTTGNTGTSHNDTGSGSSGNTRASSGCTVGEILAGNYEACLNLHTTNSGSSTSASNNSSNSSDSNTSGRCVDLVNGHCIPSSSKSGLKSLGSLLLGGGK